MMDQDKSRQQLLEELTELRRREAQWHSVVANTPVFVCLVDRAGTIQYLNRTAPGDTLEDAIGESALDFLEPDYRKIARECIERVFDTGQTAFYESVTTGPNGTTTWYESYVGPVKVDDLVVAVTLVSTDITRRKQAEDALRDSEERFKLFMDNSPAIAWMKDEQGRHVYLSNSFEKRVGVRREDRLGKTDFEVWPLETAEQFWNNDQKVLAGGQAVELIEETFDPDGTRCYWWNSKFPFQDAAGRRFVGGVGIDITKRKQAEEALQKAHEELEQRVKDRTTELRTANERLETEVEERRRIEESLRESELRLRQAMCIGKSYAFEWDAITDQAIRSPEYADILGLKDGEELCDTGQRFFQRILAEDRNRLLDALRNLTPSTNAYTVNYSLSRGDGSIAIFEETARGFFDANGLLVRLLGVVADITQRKQAEEALRTSEERYELAVRGAGVGIWDWDIRTGKVYYSPRWKTIFGYGENDIGDGVEDWARLLHPDERDWILKFQEDFLAGTSPTVTVEYRLRHKDGSYRWIVAHAVVVRDDQGKACRFVGSHGDVTDRKRVEEALRKEHRTLKHLLQSSDHERQLIAYEIHDGLAQQLAGAIMQFQTFEHLKDTYPKQAAKAYDAGLTMLQQGHFETRRLIAGVRPPILDESGVVAAVGHLVNEQSRSKGPKLDYHSRVSFDRLVPTLENAIYRIAQEALTNACKHSKSENVRVSLLQQEDRVRIEIRDWGTGFDTKAVKGNRFGLEGIRQRARLLGGKCNIRSSPGKGTRITVDLPVVLRDEES